MFLNLLLKIKDWAMGNGKDVCIILAFCLALFIYMKLQQAQEVARYEQILQITTQSHAQEVQTLKTTYNEQIKALGEIDKKYQAKLDTLISQYQVNLTKINEKQEELYKAYSQNVDVLKLALKEVFALEEGK